MGGDDAKSDTVGNVGSDHTDDDVADSHHAGGNDVVSDAGGG